MIDEVDTKEWRDWKSSVEELEHLNRFYAGWNEPNRKIEEIWKSYRLLPRGPMYFIASNYQTNQWAWLFTTKWDLVTNFETALSGGENPKKVSNSIAAAIKTQQKIVALQKFLATVKDRTKTHQDRVHVYEDLQRENPELYKELVQKLQVVTGRLIDAGNAKIEPPQQLEDIFSKTVKQMLFLYKEGYSSLGDSSFKDLLKEKNR